MMKSKARVKPKIASYPRDMVGYGKALPDPKWPGRARLALQISLNYNAGGELNVMHGDRVSEAMLTDIGFPTVKGARSPLVESSFEYGSRRGVWRLLRLFGGREIAVRIPAGAAALARHPGGGARARAQPRGARRHDRGRPRDREPSLSLDRLPARTDFGRTPPCAARGRVSHRSDRGPAGRLDDRTAKSEHPAAAGRGRRLSLRPRRAQRRAAVLDRGGGPTALGHSVFLRDQRQSLRRQRRLRDRAGFFHLHEGHL